MRTVVHIITHFWLVLAFTLLFGDLLGDSRVDRGKRIARERTELCPRHIVAVVHGLDTLARRPRRRQAARCAMILVVGVVAQLGAGPSAASRLHRLHLSAIAGQHALQLVRCGHHRLPCRTVAGPDSNTHILNYKIN